ncbi:Flp pilus assembly complex ATPase component TadA [Clostridium botulinum]|uniref:ATPase, T2SS/T4P/T4SS family n=1 Tax=Clostridium botulinum TaxID=1491 RepID=UPI00174A0CD9|nr:ATPase, T2SS/T4P/T4SS family [Clostridium botulinum]MBD5639890.1 Flp pilus assembly complex ATPase component TadA [Clostridium botulinum]MDI6919078.1 ATPase, T2SS/T4P/T4SS family [Clostridium botulinum]WMU99705.1 ATPase, T2SS/T4P/T4SS family [Clostridium botulinum]
MDKEISNIDLNALMDMKCLSKEEADYLAKSMRGNKNIIITGRIGIGKTTLLNSLLDYQDNVNIMTFERVKELNLSEIAVPNDSKNSRLIINEIQNSDDGLRLLSALNMGSSVLGTIYSKGNWHKYFLDLFSGNMKKYAEETLNKNKFIQVNISINSDGKRIVDKIQEV